MEPVPGWTRAIGIGVGIGTVLLLVPAIALGAVSLLSTVAQVDRTTSFAVGPAPRLEVDGRFGTFAIEASLDGRIVVEDQRSAGSISRATAVAALDQMAVDVSRQGDVVRVRQMSQPLSPPSLDRNSVVTIRVPARTELDLNDAGSLRIQGIDATVHVSGPGSVELRDSTLAGASTLDVPFGTVQLTNVTVAGSTAVTSTLAGISFDGRLASGGSSLAIEDGGGDVSVILPRPTDARAVISTQAGQFRADGTWLFTPDQVAAPRRWVADLGPNPTGTVTVHSNLGSVDFRSRPDRA